MDNENLEYMISIEINIKASILVGRLIVSLVDIHFQISDLIR